MSHKQRETEGEIIAITHVHRMSEMWHEGVNHYYQPLENAARNTELLLQGITQQLNNYCESRTKKMAHMNTENIDNKEDQYVWNMATSAIRTGGRLKVIGSVLSVLSVVSGLILALMYLVVMEGDYAVVGVVMSLVGIVPAFAMGQFLSLYGTRGVLHGIQVQNTILDLDTDE